MIRKTTSPLSGRFRRHILKKYATVLIVTRTATYTTIYPEQGPAVAGGLWTRESCISAMGELFFGRRTP